MKMTLCYDFQKWIILSLGLVAGSLTVGLMQYTYATIEDEQKATCAAIKGSWIDGKCMVDSNLIQLRQQLENSIEKLQTKQQGFDGMINYCFQHADRPNPLQDLVDKGLMSANMTGITCKDVKQMSDINQNQISDLTNNLSQLSVG